MRHTDGQTVDWLSYSCGRVLRCNSELGDVDCRAHHLNIDWQMVNKNFTVNTLATVLTLTVTEVTAARRTMTVVSAPLGFSPRRRRVFLPTTRCRRYFQLTATPPDTLSRLSAPVRTADISTSTSSLPGRRRLKLSNRTPLRRLQNAVRNTMGRPSYGPPAATVL